MVSFWTNGKIVLSGRYNYNWAKDNFSVSINEKCSSLRNLDFITHDDSVGFGKFVLLKIKQTCDFCGENAVYLLKNRRWSCDNCCESKMVIGTHSELVDKAKAKLGNETWRP